jgi:hypothetical protein
MVVIGASLLFVLRWCNIVLTKVYCTFPEACSTFLSHDIIVPSWWKLLDADAYVEQPSNYDPSSCPEKMRNCSLTRFHLANFQSKTASVETDVSFHFRYFTYSTPRYSKPLHHRNGPSLHERRMNSFKIALKKASYR